MDFNGSPLTVFTLHLPHAQARTYVVHWVRFNIGIQNKIWKKKSEKGMTEATASTALRVHTAHMHGEKLERILRNAYVSSMPATNNMFAAQCIALRTGCRSSSSATRRIERRRKKGSLTWKSRTLHYMSSERKIPHETVSNRGERWMWFIQEKCRMRKKSFFSFLFRFGCWLRLCFGLSATKWTNIELISKPGKTFNVCTGASLCKHTHAVLSSEWLSRERASYICAVHTFEIASERWALCSCDLNCVFIRTTPRRR